MSKYIQKDTLDLGLLLFRIRSHWYYFVIVLPLALGLAFLYISTKNKVYSFTSQIMMGSRRTGSKGADELLNIIQDMEKRINVEDEMGLISSYDMIRNTVKKLDFGVSYYAKKRIRTSEHYNDFPFKVVIDSAQNQLVNVPFTVEILSDKQYRIGVKVKSAGLYNPRADKFTGTGVQNVEWEAVQEFGRVYRSKLFSFKLVPTERFGSMAGQEMFFTLNDPDAIAGQFAGKLEVKPLEKESYILVMNTTGSVAEKEIAFLNALMHEFIAEDLHTKNLRGRKTLDFVQKQLEEAQQSLTASAGSLQSFKAANQFADPGVLATSSYANLDKLENEKAETSLRLEYYRNLMRQFDNGGALSEMSLPASHGITDGFLTNQLTDLIKINDEKVRRGYSATDKNPLIQEADAQLANKRKQIKEYLASNIRAFELPLQNLNRRIAEIKGKIGTLPENQRRMEDLRTSFEFNQREYEKLLAKKQEAEILLATNTPDSRVVDVAKQDGDTPKSPNTKFIYMLALLAGLGLPIAVIVVRDLLNDKVSSPDDIASVTNIPVVGVVARGDKNSKLALAERPKSLLAESFRSLRVNLEYLDGQAKEVKVVGVTSTISEEGKTFCALNLATAFAVAGYRTLLINADLHKPQGDEFLVQNNEEGLTSYLAGRHALAQIISRSPIANLDVICSGTVPGNPMELLDSAAMERLMAQLRLMYDRIVIDAPPLGYVSDYYVLKKYTDANLYVVRAGRVSNKLLDEINGLYESQKINNLGIVLNDLKFSESYTHSFKEKKHKYYY